MGIWRKLRCIFSPRHECDHWDSEEDEMILYLRAEKKAAEEAAIKMRRARLSGDPITRVYGGWDRKDQSR